MSKTCEMCGTEISNPGPCPGCEDKPYGTYQHQKNIQIFQSEEGEWSQMYLDGKLIDEGHRIDLVRVLKALGFRITVTRNENGTKEG